MLTVVLENGTFCIIFLYAIQKLKIEYKNGAFNLFDSILKEVFILTYQGCFVTVYWHLPKNVLDVHHVDQYIKTG